MDYYIDRDRRKRNTAGAKAPADISKICEKKGMKCFPMPLFPEEKNKIYQKCWLLVVGYFYWFKLYAILKSGDRVIYQHPMYANRIALKMIPKIQKKKQCKFVVVIHDLESLRKGINGLIKNNEKTNYIADNLLLDKFDYIICHNKYMKKYLMNQGIQEKKIVCLEIFDYLCKIDKKEQTKEDKASIAIAGNLAKGKSGYIYEFIKDNSGLGIHLYGINYEKTKCNSDVIYHGSFSPEELPEKLEGNFGLVWDGSSAQSCVGNTGEYLKYNNPHKTSLYLASGIPVIIWKHAAMADFVLDNKVGIVVDSLYDIKHAIEDISNSQYKEMCRNVKDISEKLRKGYYFTKALEKCR